MTNTTEISYIDAATKIPSVRYLIVDSVDVEKEGVQYHDTRYKGYDNYVVFWAFPVKGRKDVWVTIALNMISGKSIPLDEQRKRCLRLLHSRQKYEQAKDDTYKKRIVHYISLSTSRIDKNKKLILLNRIGDTANFKDN